MLVDITGKKLDPEAYWAGYSDGYGKGYTTASIEPKPQGGLWFHILWGIRRWWAQC